MVTPLLSDNAVQLAKQMTEQAAMSRPILSIELAKGIRPWSRDASGAAVWERIDETSWVACVTDWSQYEERVADFAEKCCIEFKGVKVLLSGSAQIAKGTLLVEARAGFFVLQHSLEGDPRREV